MHAKKRLFIAFYTSKNNSQFVTTVNAEWKKRCVILMSFDNVQIAHSLARKILCEVTRRY